MDDLAQFLKESHIDTILLALVILVLSLIASHYATKYARTVMTSNGRQLPKGSIVENILRGLIWMTGGSLILAYCFNVDVDGLVAALGVGGIALSLGLQDTISNVFGGVQVAMLGILEPGDHVAIDSIEGIVQSVNWRQTTLEDFEGSLHVIPNSMINANKVDKYYPNHIVSTLINFANDSQNLNATIAEMERLAKEAVSKVAVLERDPWILLIDIGEYGTHAKLRFVLKDIRQARVARDVAIRAISHYAHPTVKNSPFEGRVAPAALNGSVAQNEGAIEALEPQI